MRTAGSFINPVLNKVFMTQTKNWILALQGNGRSLGWVGKPFSRTQLNDTLDRSENYVGSNLQRNHSVGYWLLSNQYLCLTRIPRSTLEKCSGIWGGFSGRWLGSEIGILMSGIERLFRELPLLCTTWADSEKVGVTSESMTSGNKEAWKLHWKCLYIFL